MTDSSLPLVVDLDGTLLRTDLLYESFFAWMGKAPLKAIASLLTLRGGIAPFKAAIARAVTLDVLILPVNASVLAYLEAEHAKGRALYLASASHETYVKSVAEHLGLFTGYFGSSATHNLKGAAKAAALVEAFGVRGFDYIGNDVADFAVWQQTAGIFVTTTDTAFEQAILRQFPGAQAIAQPHPTRRDFLKALRAHQWLKNLLILVPMFAAHEFSIENLAIATLAFASFCALASSGYLLNDLLDLSSDRAHHRKRYRAFAAGIIPIATGVRMLAALFATSMLLGLFLPSAFIITLLLYYVLTLAYSSILKRRMMLDVVVLALLYALRLVAGGVATGVALSAWLLSFASFFFLSLALIKRSAELVQRRIHDEGDPKGRDYRISDLPMLESMAAASGYVAALTSGLYINGGNVSALYSNPGYLWAMPVILLYWVSRMLMLTHRGQMVDDPVLFAVRDRVSLICGGLLVFVLFVSM